jgi:integrase
MKFLLQRRGDASAGASPYRVVEAGGAEVAWVNRFLDMQRVRGLNELSLRFYGHLLLHFIRWWDKQPGVEVMRMDAPAFTESTLVDYVRAQREQLPRLTPGTINNRSAMLRRLFRFCFQVEMPHGPYRLPRVECVQPGRRYRRGRIAVAADLRLKVPPRVIEPLSREQVQRFWSSFRTARDIAAVGLLLLSGLRSCEVLALQLEDLLLSEAQLRVRGKGGKMRVLPLPPETIRLLDCYLKTERPPTNAAQVFVSLKGKARGKPTTKAGWRSLFITALRRPSRKPTRIGSATPSAVT